LAEDGFLYNDTNLLTSGASWDEGPPENDQTVNYIYCLRGRELLFNQRICRFS